MNVDETRCYGITGDVWTGPQYCGFKAKGLDANKRPCCGRHLGREALIRWEGERGEYPHGVRSWPPGRHWDFRNGKKRGES